LTVTDFGEAANGVVYLVMEYLRGRTLKNVVRSEGPMPLARVAEIIRQICGALDAAHSEGVVHRDLKSDNIMLEEVGAVQQDWAKVLDFGIAKIQEPEGGQDPALTAPNLIIGTPQYMSPEQCSQSSEIDARSDIYSLGVILYEMLTGRVPFTGDSPTAIMMKHMQEPAPSVLEEREGLPASIGRVVARALSKRPEDRYQSAGELSEALTLAAADEASSTVVSTGAATGESLRQGATTNRIVVSTGGNEAPPRTNEDRDDATVVREAAAPLSGGVKSPGAATMPPPPAASFNPWRIAVPAFVLLLVVFGVFYAFQRDSGEPEPGDEATAPLTADPAGQPVQSAAPATGEGERDILPGRPVPSPSPQAGATGNENTNTDGNSNTNAEPSPAPGDSPTENQNDNAQRNENSNAEPKPTPQANGNANQRRVPPSVPDTTGPRVDVDPHAPPPPAPKPKPQTPAATPPAPGGDAPAPSGPRAR
ncbi:MAG: protein kinase domain-containing protein, partial [Pyrinomonadaceae bacterium]